MYLRRELHLVVSETPWDTNKYYELVDEVKVTLVDGTELCGCIQEINLKSLVLTGSKYIPFSDIDSIVGIDEIEETDDTISSEESSACNKLDAMILGDLRDRLAEAETKCSNIDPNTISEVAKEYTPIEIPTDVVVNKIEEVEK